jgi:hypothetical protein
VNEEYNTKIVNLKNRRTLVRPFCDIKCTENFDSWIVTKMRWEGIRYTKLERNVAVKLLQITECDLGVNLNKFSLICTNS